MTDITFFDGSWQTSHYYFVHSDDGDTIIYYLRTPTSNPLTGHNSIKYVRSTLTWSDNLPIGEYDPYTFSSSSDPSTQQYTVVNPEFLYGWDSVDMKFGFTNPHWEPPTPPPNTNSVSDVFVSYVVEDNELRVYIPLDKPSTVHPNPDPAGRDLYYQLRKVSGASFFVRIVHTQGTATNETIVPTTAGIYQLEKVQTNPTVYTTYDTAEVSQAQLDFYATNNPPDDDPPDDDPPENDPPPTPVFVPRSARRGNLNFW